MTNPYTAFVALLPKDSHKPPASNPYASRVVPLHTNAKPTAPLNPFAAGPGNTEGTYSLEHDGKRLEVPYSKVAKARKEGYRFSDLAVSQQYGQDYAADSAHKDELMIWADSHPVMGAPDIDGK